MTILPSLLVQISSWARRSYEGAGSPQSRKPCYKTPVFRNAQGNGNVGFYFPACHVDNFSSFNLDSIMTDIKSKMPVTFGFVTEFGDSRRNMHCEAVVPVKGIKALFSLLVLLNAHSNRANGMQALIGYNYVITMQRKWLCNVYLRADTN